MTSTLAGVEALLPVLIYPSISLTVMFIFSNLIVRSMYIYLSFSSVPCSNVTFLRGMGAGGDNSAKVFECTEWSSFEMFRRRLSNQCVFSEATREKLLRCYSYFECRWHFCFIKKSSHLDDHSREILFASSQNQQWLVNWYSESINSMTHYSA